MKSVCNEVYICAKKKTMNDFHDYKYVLMKDGVYDIIHRRIFQPTRRLIDPVTNLVINEFFRKNTIRANYEKR